MTPDVCHTRDCPVMAWKQSQERVSFFWGWRGGHMGSVGNMMSSNSSYFLKAPSFWNEKCCRRCILGWWGTCEKMRHAIQNAESQLTHQRTQNVLINTAAVPNMCVSSGSICWLPESKSRICRSSVPPPGLPWTRWSLVIGTWKTASHKLWEEIALKSHAYGHPLSDSKHKQPTGCLKAKPEALSASMFIFTNNGKDDLRDVFIKFTDGASPELARKRSDRIMIQNFIYRLQE